MRQRATSFASVITAMLLAGSIAAQQSPSTAKCAQVVADDSRPSLALSDATWNAIYDAGAQCVPVWTDSLRSTSAPRVARAAQALAMIGDSVAVNALRAEYVRTPNRVITTALIEAIGATGTAEDVAFLTRQLAAPDWSTVFAAVNTLGLLRAKAARPSIEALTQRFAPGTFVNRGAVAALKALDDPPCVAAASDTVAQALKDLIMRCTPQALWTGRRYRERDGNGVWEFGNEGWRLAGNADADTTSLTVTITVRLAGDGRNAEVTLSTFCGRLCGEGWSYRLARSEATWRVVASAMRWVS